MEELYEKIKEYHDQNINSDLLKVTFQQKKDKSKYVVIYSEDQFNLLIEDGRYLIEIETQTMDFKIPDEKEIISYIDKKIRENKINSIFEK